jgi:hypothetical protein
VVELSDESEEDDDEPMPDLITSEEDEDSAEDTEENESDGEGVLLEMWLFLTRAPVVRQIRAC